VIRTGAAVEIKHRRRSIHHAPRLSSRALRPCPRHRLGDVTASALKRVAEKLAKRYCDQRILGLPLDVTQEESTKRFALGRRERRVGPRAY
jgi:hypothetical protein